jgi:hypothetical protein
MINNKLSDYLRGKELPLSKANLAAISSFTIRLKTKSGHESVPINCSPFAVRACFDAIYSSYGKIKDPESPALALYEHLHFKKIP